MAEIEKDKYDKYDKNNKHFYYHFKSADLCKQMTLKYNIKVKYYCCDNKGFAIDYNNNYINELNHLLNNPDKKEIIKKTTDNFCCVCWEKSNTLTKCGHILCSGCSKKVVELCPYCRTKL
jgi:hypothetical protein